MYQKGKGGEEVSNDLNIYDFTHFYSWTSDSLYLWTVWWNWYFWLVENLLPQSKHSNLFSSWTALICCRRLLGWLKAFSQIWHEYVRPWCRIIWLYKDSRLLSNLPHSLHWYSLGVELSPSCKVSEGSAASSGGLLCMAALLNMSAGMVSWIAIELLAAKVKLCRDSWKLGSMDNVSLFSSLCAALCGLLLPIVCAVSCSSCLLLCAAPCGNIFI